MLRRHAHRPTVTLSRVPQDARPHRICCSGRRRKEKAAHSPRPYGNCTAGAALRSQMHACRPRKICTPHFFFFTDRGMLGACGGFSGARYEFTLASPSFFLFPALPCPRRFQLSLLHGECHCCTGVYAGAYTLLVNDEGCAVLPNYVGGLVLHQDIGRLQCVCVCVCIGVVIYRAGAGAYCKNMLGMCILSVRCCKSFNISHHRACSLGKRPGETARLRAFWMICRGLVVARYLSPPLRDTTALTPCGLKEHP